MHLGMERLDPSSRHSGNPVRVDTSMTGTPVSAMVLAVEPVETIPPRRVQGCGEFGQPRSCRRHSRAPGGWVGGRRLREERSRDAGLSSFDDNTFGDQGGHHVCEQFALDDLDPFVQGVGGVVVGDLDGPLSQDRSGVDAVVDEVNRCPVTFTPCARASATPCAPGNDGSSAGCELTMWPPKRARNCGPRIFMKPAVTTQSGSACSVRSRNASSQTPRSGWSVTRQVNDAMPASRAISTQHNPCRLRQPPPRTPTRPA